MLEKHVFTWAHVEHGLGMHVYTPAQRDAPTNMINNALAVAAAHKLRFAQDLILFNLEVDGEVEDFHGSAHQEAWQSDPIWQPTREVVEGLTGIRDWAEAFFATAVVFEPLVGELFRSGFVMQAAAPQGDFVTPTIIGTGESDAARDQRGARALFSMLADGRARRGEPADDAGMAVELHAADRQRRPPAAADLVPAVREARPLRRLPRALAGGSRTCRRTSASKPRRSSHA